MVLSLTTGYVLMWYLVEHRIYFHVVVLS